MTDQERITQLENELATCLDCVRAHSQYGAETVAKLQYMSGRDTRELVATWLSENRVYQHALAVLKNI